MEWKGKSVIKYFVASPYTLMVPTAYPEAMNLNLPEYSWAPCLMVALHSVRLAVNNDVGCDVVPLS